MADQTSPSTDYTTTTPISTTANEPPAPSTPMANTTPAVQPAPAANDTASTTTTTFSAATTIQVPATAHTAPHTTAPPRTLADILRSYHERATPEQQRDWEAIVPHIIASQRADRPIMFIAGYGPGFQPRTRDGPDLEAQPSRVRIVRGGRSRQRRREQRRSGWYFVAIVVTVCVGCLAGVGIAWMQSRWSPLEGHRSVEA